MSFPSMTVVRSGFRNMRVFVRSLRFSDLERVSGNVRVSRSEKQKKSGSRESAESE